MFWSRTFRFLFPLLGIILLAFDNSISFRIQEIKHINDFVSGHKFVNREAVEYIPEHSREIRIKEDSSTSYGEVEGNEDEDLEQNNKPSHQRKVICYFTNWAWYRQGIGQFYPEDVNVDLCTHIQYAFAMLEYSQLIVQPFDTWADIDNKFYERVIALKKKNKPLKVLLSLGGWNESAGDKYSRLVNNQTARQNFASKSVEFLQKFGFDGLDIDWEYPKCWQGACVSGPASDKPNFGLLLKEVKAAFKPHKLILSAAVSASKVIIEDAYDIQNLVKSLDWISVMTYDYHGSWDGQTGHVAPLYYHPDDTCDYFNANYSIHYWINKGVPANKIIMGVPFYGQSFSLADPKNHGLNAKTWGPGLPGEITNASGFLSFYEILDRIKNKGWTVVQDPKHRMGPYAYSNNQWVSFDDKDTVKQKANYIKKLGLGGGMIWALDLDDFKNTQGSGVYPLLTTLSSTLLKR